MHDLALPKLRFAGSPRRFWKRVGAALGFGQTKEVGQPDAEQAETAGAQHLAPRQPAAQSFRRSQNSQHEQPPGMAIILRRGQ